MAAVHPAAMCQSAMGLSPSEDKKAIVMAATSSQWKSLSGASQTLKLSLRLVFAMNIICLLGLCHKSDC